MWKFVAVCAALCLGTALRAGELDKEKPLFRVGTAALAQAPTEAKILPAASELDRESPAQTCGWRRCWGGGAYVGYYGGGCGPYYASYYPTYYYPTYYYAPPVYTSYYYRPVYYGWRGGFYRYW
jgi:hypothetical protein